MSERRTSWETSAWWLRLIIGRRPLRTLVRMLVLVGVAVLLFKVLLVPIRVTGMSMEPTYHDGRINFLNRYAYRWHPPRRGDVVGAEDGRSRLMLLKRVLGLPGEHVSISDGRIAIDGRLLDEPYVEGVGQLQYRASALLRDQQYFIIGDNRRVSAYGVVQLSQIKGKVLF